MSRRRPGEVRDAIVHVLGDSPAGASVRHISSEVARLIGDVSPSSVRSYLRLNTPELFARMDRAQYALAGLEEAEPQLAKRQQSAATTFSYGRSSLIHQDCLSWLAGCTKDSIHAVVTDPPYGLIEYSDQEQAKLREGRGGVWRIPPSFDGARRAPLPRFTVLKPADLAALDVFFLAWGRSLLRVLVPGANVVVASNPLLSHLVSMSLSRAGLERRGELVRLVMTMRGGGISQLFGRAVNPLAFPFHLDKGADRGLVHLGNTVLARSSELGPEFFIPVGRLVPEPGQDRQQSLCIGNWRLDLFA